LAETAGSIRQDAIVCAESEALRETGEIAEGGRTLADAFGEGGSPMARETGAGRVYPAVKRGSDFFAASVSLLLFSPLFLIIALLVKIDSPGPVFFRQTRIGKSGKPFRFFKFRSMIRDAERHKAALRDLNEAEEPLFKIRRDPRVTAVGYFLRRTSLDELPQMINVLKGDMSLVGPRPHLPEEVSRYRESDRERLKVVPGITCLWQATNRRSTQFHEWIDSDIEYVRKRSLWLDLKILWKTLIIVISLKEAS